MLTVLVVGGVEEDLVSIDSSAEPITTWLLEVATPRAMRDVVGEYLVKQQLEPLPEGQVREIAVRFYLRAESLPYLATQLLETLEGPYREHVRVILERQVPRGKGRPRVEVFVEHRVAKKEVNAEQLATAADEALKLYAVSRRGELQVQAARQRIAVVEAYRSELAKLLSPGSGLQTALRPIVELIAATLYVDDTSRSEASVRFGDQAKVLLQQAQRLNLVPYRPHSDKLWLQLAGMSINASDFDNILAENTPLSAYRQTVADLARHIRLCESLGLLPQETDANDA